MASVIVDDARAGAGSSSISHRPRHRALRLRFDQLIAVGFFAALFARVAHSPAQNDTWWQLRAGDDIWHGLMPTTERWTFTFRGSFWPDHEWLSQAIFSLLYRIGGMPVLTVCTAAVVTAAFVVVWRLMEASAWKRVVLLTGTVPATLITSAVRPQVASLLVLVIVLWAVQERRFFLLPLLFLLWANLHGAFVIGAVAVAAALIVAFVTERDIARPFVVATTFTAICTFLTPLGPRVLGLFLATSGQTDIEEWRPAWDSGVAGACLACVAVAFVVAILRLRRVGPWEWRNHVFIAAGAVVLPIAARYSRVIPMFTLIALVVVARAWEGWKPSATRDDATTLNTILGVAFVALAGTWVLQAWVTDDPSLGWHPLPTAAIDAARQCDGRMYNRFDEGGFLVYFAPDIPNFVDGRVDPFPQSFLREHFRDEATGDYREIFQKWDITCAFLPATSPTAQTLLRDGWTVVYGDGTWLVLQQTQLAPA